MFDADWTVPLEEPTLESPTELTSKPQRHLQLKETGAWSVVGPKALDIGAL
jgi:hypothetical protein